MPVLTDRSRRRGASRRKARALSLFALLTIAALPCQSLASVYDSLAPLWGPGQFTADMREQTFTIVSEDGERWVLDLPRAYGNRFIGGDGSPGNILNLHALLPDLMPLPVALKRDADAWQAAHPGEPLPSELKSLSRNWEQQLWLTLSGPVFPEAEYFANVRKSYSGCLRSQAGSGIIQLSEAENAKCRARSTLVRNTQDNTTRPSTSYYLIESTGHIAQCCGMQRCLVYDRFQNWSLDVGIHESQLARWPEIHTKVKALLEAATVSIETEKREAR